MKMDLFESDEDDEILTQLLEVIEDENLGEKGNFVHSSVRFVYSHSAKVHILFGPVLI